MMPAPGDLVAGKYRIERKLAEGGMGVLFEATHLQLEELVAIKFLREEVASKAEGDAVERFLREARSSIKLRSEHVVRILDVAALESGVPYIVMELLVGKDLDQIVTQSGPLPPTDAVDFVLQACEALAEAHQRGIVHRDIKPANLFLASRADGSPCIKVLDFGISKVSTGPGGKDLGLTNTQAVMGSPRYMSPEQLRASKSVDARCDIWAIGIVLYELLTGAPPFDGETMTAVCAAILQDQPASMTASRPEIPAALEAVVLRALEKDPARRFGSVAELAEGLRAFASSSGVTSVGRVQGTMRGSSPLFVTQTIGSLNDVDVVAVQAPTAVPAPGALTSTAWGDVPSKGRAKRGRAALAAGVAAVLVLSGLGYARFTKNQPEAAPGLVAAAPIEVVSGDLPASKLLPLSPPPAVLAASGGVPSAGEVRAGEPPAAASAPAATNRTRQSVAPKGAPLAPAAPPTALSPPASPSPASPPPAGSASAPMLWNGRK